MPDDPVFLITGASTGIGAATARHAAAGRATASCSPPARPTSSRRSPPSSAATERAIAVACDVTEWERPAGASSRRALERFGRIDVVFANAGFGGARGFLEADDLEHWRAMVLTNVYGAALTDPRDDARAEGVAGPPAADRLGRRPARAAGSLYSATKWAVTGDGRGRRARSSTAPASA